ncbi:MAG: outer membrane protein assembly factor BamA [Candidatus Omnitrophota bacterium]
MLRRISIIVFFILFLSLSFTALPPLSAQTESEQGPSAPATSLPIVRAIEVKGNKTISSNTVISKMKTRVGSPYQENIISDDLKRLYLLGFFSDIKIDTEPYKDGLKIMISVVERPIIEKITFSGLRRLRTTSEKLKKELRSQETKYLDYPDLADDVRTLSKKYEKIGYSEAKVDYKVEIDEKTNKAKIQFNLEEGKRVRIKDILTIGNNAFPRSRILRLIKTKRAWTFNPGVLKEDVLKDDMERISSFYRRAGFTDVAVTYEIVADSLKPYLLYIHIKIDEGKKYLVGNIDVRGNRDIDLSEILASLKECVPGKVFSQEALQVDVANIQSLYFDRGYISCQVREASSVNPSTGRVDILYTIAEHEIAYVDKIKIRGNVKSRDVVVRRELRIFPGDRFDGEKLRRSRERLQNLGFFEQVSYDTEDTDVPDKKNLVVDVKETKTGAFSFGGGYSSVDKLIGFIEVEQKNFDWKNFPYFTGAGQDLRLRASFGTISSGFDLSYTNPWVFDYPVSFGFDAYRHTRDREEDVGYAYDEKITGGDLRLGKELSEYVRGNITYRYDVIDISNVDPAASNALLKEAGINTVSSLTPGLAVDSRDNVFDPRKGDLISGSFQLAGGPFAGDKDFWKFNGRFSHYFPLPKDSALEIRMRVGAGEPYGDSQEIPIYERFFAGGAYTIRGYEERSVGPVDPLTNDPLGGQALLVGNIEYTIPLYQATDKSFKISAAAFYDTGNVWAKLNDLGSGSFYSGMGFGVRLKTPIGPIQVDYGIPLNKAPGEQDKGSGRVHFSAGHSF